MITVLQKKIVAENANLKEGIKALITENDSLKAKIVELYQISEIRKQTRTYYL